MDNKDQKSLKDHRQIGQEQELFFVHEYAPGAIFWLPKGWIIYQQLVQFIREKIKDEGYQEISTPVMVKNALFKKSGHWEHFGQHNMFNLSVYEEDELKHIDNQLQNKQGEIIDEAEKKLLSAPTVTLTKTIELKGSKIDILVTVTKIKEGNYSINYDPTVNYSLKPMNCPEATLVFAHKPRSYKELPIKLSEFGILHRRELSGVLGGLLRVRQFMIDDAHLFVRPDQIMKEIHKLLALVMNFYKSLGFEPRFYLATRPDKAMGDPEMWKVAERDLEEALKQTKVKYEIKEKDGAFYGPKIDAHIEDSQGRDWQLATIQLDFMMPERMELEYIDSKGQKVRPVMIHRGIFGSVERFIGMLIEHFQGAFPLWLAPVQVVIIPISEKHHEAAKKMAETLKDAGIRVEVDDRADPMQGKIRDATLQKVPFMGIIGDKEIADTRISVRTRSGENLGLLTESDFRSRLLEEIERKS